MRMKKKGEKIRLNENETCVTGSILTFESFFHADCYDIGIDGELINISCAVWRQKANVENRNGSCCSSYCANGFLAVHINFTSSPSRKYFFHVEQKLIATHKNNSCHIWHIAVVLHNTRISMKAHYSKI